VVVPRNFYYYYPRAYYPFGFGAFGLGYFYYDPYLWAPYGYNPYYSVSVGVGVGYGPFYAGGVYSPYPYAPYAYGPGYGYYGSAVGSLRIQVKPKDAEVYVNGYYAGHVDDFDGAFQALDLQAGSYRIEVRAPGFEPLEFNVQIQPGHKTTYQGDLHRKI
jgi:hypothetical protein